MIKTFKNFPELTSSLAFDLIDMIKRHDFGSIDVYAAFGFSNVSPSAYVEFSAEDEDGETVCETKVRFSDHADRHGSDITIRIDHVISTVEEDGEYIATEISDEDYSGMLQAAMTHVRNAVAAV
jgi:hypothetical protein